MLALNGVFANAVDKESFDQRVTKFDNNAARQFYLKEDIINNIKDIESIHRRTEIYDMLFKKSFDSFMEIKNKMERRKQGAIILKKHLECVEKGIIFISSRVENIYDQVSAITLNTTPSLKLGT